jgi:predicted nucleotidyltransferase component of viral defense system
MNMLNEYQWENILAEAERLAIPAHKKRALIREYLQSKILYYLYHQKESKNLSFIGGTSLRILRGLDRFSEDLDFDNLGLSFTQVKVLFSRIKSKLEREGVEIEYQIKKTNGSATGNFKFPRLLSDLGISRDKREKLNIKIDYSTPSGGLPTEVIVMSRFGLVQVVVTNTLECLMAQKIRAIVTRKDIQPRDFYDLVWFMSRSIRPDFSLLARLGIKNEKQAADKLGAIYESRVMPGLKNFKGRLKPFLIEEKNVSYLDVFGKMVEEKFGRVDPQLLKVAGK